jgi:NTE family protein
MLAFVLSGGGNRGPLEVGALQVLLEHGIVPDMLVGTSAGAINAAFLAVEQAPRAARDLGPLWIEAAERGIFQGNRLTMLWRLLTGKDSLYRNERFRRLMEEALPVQADRFADIKDVKLYIVATVLDSGEPRVFGRDPREHLVDAIMASTALPPFFPPWRCGDELLVDGGVAADLPIRIAVDLGATEIYALHLVDAPREGQQIRGLFSIAEQTINAVISRQHQIELEMSESKSGVKVHHVPLVGFYGLAFWDLSHTEEMIQGGRHQMEEYLHASVRVAPSERLSSRRAALKAGVWGALRRLSHLRPGGWGNRAAWGP